MKLRNLLLIFAGGTLLGAFAISFLRDAPTVSSPDAATKLEPSEPSPAPIAREPHTARPPAPLPVPPKSDPPKPAEVEQPRAPFPVGEAKLSMNRAMVSRPFDDSRLEAAGCFSSDDIALIRLRWEDFDKERRSLVGRTTLGEQAWDDANWVELQHTLHETLGDAHYEGLLWATGQTNGVLLSDVPPGSPAAEAGLRRWDQVLSYNGVQIFQRKQLEALADSEFSEHRVEIKVRHHDKTIETFMIESGPLGAQLTVTSRRSPCEDQGQ